MILAKRLETISGSLRFYGLSATIKKPEEVASRYLARADEKCKVVKRELSRWLHYECSDS